MMPITKYRKGVNNNLK